MTLKTVGHTGAAMATGAAALHAYQMTHRKKEHKMNQEIVKKAFLDEMKKIGFMVDKKVGGGEVAGNILTGGYYAPIAHTMAAKENKKLKAFGTTLGHEIGYGTLGAVGGLASGAGAGMLADKVFKKSKFAIPAALLGHMTGSMLGITKGMQSSRKSLMNQGALKVEE